MNQLEDFNGQTVELVKHNQELWLTGEQIGEALEYEDPRKGVHQLYERSREELEEYSCVLSLRVAGQNGVSQARETRVYNEEGVMLLTMLSKQPKAVEFRKWAVQVLKSYRHKKPTPPFETPAINWAPEQILELVKEDRRGSKYASSILQEIGLCPSNKETFSAPVFPAHFSWREPVERWWSEVIQRRELTGSLTVEGDLVIPNRALHQAYLRDSAKGHKLNSIWLGRVIQPMAGGLQCRRVNVGGLSGLVYCRILKSWALLRPGLGGDSLNLPTQGGPHETKTIPQKI